MEVFFVMKLLHIFSVILMVGATVFNGVLHSQAKEYTPVQSAALLKTVLIINKRFMGPSLVIIPLSGAGMVIALDYDWQALWLFLSIVVTFALLIAFIVGSRIETRLHRIAFEAAAHSQKTLPATYRSTFAKAAPIGLSALVMCLVVLILMVFRPL